jgi:hypothetical protein
LWTSYGRRNWERIAGVTFGDRTVLEDALFRIEQRCFQVDGTRSLGGRLSLHREGDAMVLTNGTAYDLLGARIHQRSRGPATVFGDVAAGQARRGMTTEDEDGGSAATYAWLMDQVLEQADDSVRAGRRVPTLVRCWDRLSTVRMSRSDVTVATIDAIVSQPEPALRLVGGWVRSEHRLSLLRAYLPLGEGE